MKVRFLLDENLSPRLKVAVLRFNPAIDILHVGDADAPPRGTLDPEILHYLELSQRLLITDNRSSMPEHFEAHYGDGGHIWGLLWVRPETQIGELVREIFLVWEASEAEEWLDRLDWIPL